MAALLLDLKRDASSTIFPAMGRRQNRLTRAALLLGVLGFILNALPAASVTIYDPVLPFRNTSATGLSAGEVTLFELQGRFRGFVGTPIGPNHFLTAQHIGAGAGLADTIVFDSGANQGTYTLAAEFDDPNSDLRIVEINESFPSWAPLYLKDDEEQKALTVFGRGTQPGDGVFVGGSLHGWRNGTADGVLSWGRNVVVDTLGSELRFDFNRNGPPNEAALTTGDSAGAVIIQDADLEWKLAGINFSTSGPFQQDAQDPPPAQGSSPVAPTFKASLFDRGGLWIGPAGGELFIPDVGLDSPTRGTATRISDRLSWISLFVALPPDADGDGIPDATDNCLAVANPDQLDRGGVGNSGVDGIGDACQCGDVTTDGVVNGVDSIFIRRQALGLASPLFLAPGNCDVTGDGQCNGIDAIFIERAALGLPAPLFGQNCPNAGLAF